MILAPIKLFIGTLLLGGWTYLTCCVPVGNATLAEHVRRIAETPQAQAMAAELRAAMDTYVLVPLERSLKDRLLAWAQESGEDGERKM